MTEPVLTTEIADYDTDHVRIRGLDLASEVMGRLTFADVLFLLLCRRVPNADERRLLDAILVSLVEHGLTPSAIVARATYASAPESLKGAVAAGLLGAGSVVLGSMEECARLLTDIGDKTLAGASVESEAAAVAAAYGARKERLPGLGHRIHTAGDPRAPRLFEIAAECGRSGRHVESMRALSAAASAEAGKPLHINITGAAAAVLLELGIPWQLHRGFAVISRSAGLVAHIGEELERPITPALRRMVGRAPEPGG